LFALFLLLLSASTLFCGDKNKGLENDEAELLSIIRNKIYPFVLNEFLYNDFRPLHQAETKQVTEYFITSFKARFFGEEKDVVSLREKGLLLLYNQSREPVEDGSDYYYTNLNRSVVYMSLSLISDKDREEVFLQEALEILEPDSDDFHLYYSFCLMIDLIYAIEGGSEKVVTYKYSLLNEALSEENEEYELNKIKFLLYDLCKRNSLLLSSQTEGGMITCAHPCVGIHG
jgi:hypothetical protein